MQSCLLEGKQIYAFDIIGKNDTVHFELEKEYRLASKKNLLKCCECGSKVIFKFRDLEKRKPHFAHFDQSKTRSCSYAKETEEHIEGKRIILNRMRELYPDIHHQIRYRVKSINRFADLFFRLDELQLIIEFQRTDLDANIFEEKIKDYSLTGINTMWILSGSKEEFKTFTREHNLTFFQRLNLNTENKPIIFLNVDNQTITLMEKFVYSDNDTKSTFIDRLFYKTYPVDDLIIKLNGTIESDFEESCRIEKKEFIKECERMLVLEEKNRIGKNPYYISNADMNLKKNKSKIKPESMDVNYKVYNKLIRDLLDNYSEDQFKLISGACYNNQSVNQIVKQILVEEIEKGNLEAKTILNKIIEFTK